MKLTCPHPDCQKDLLTSAGLHQKIRWLPWVRCTLWHLCTWPAEDVRGRSSAGAMFHCSLASKLACDFEVVKFMRLLGLGNSSSQIQCKQQSHHADIWLQKTVQYLTDCKGTASAVTSSLILPVTFEPAPSMPSVPKHWWLMQVYTQYVQQRLDEIKATITSQYGRILKMDSTKKKWPEN